MSKKMTQKEFNETIKWIMQEKSKTEDTSNGYLEILFDLLCRYRKASEECKDIKLYGMSNDYDKLADRLNLTLVEHGFYDDLF